MRRHRLTCCLLLAACGDDSSTVEPDVDGSSSTTGRTTIATTLETTSDPGPSSSSSSSESSSDASSSSGEDDSSSDTGAPEASPCDRYDAFVDELSAAEPNTRAVLTDAFVREAQYSATGLPLRCDDRVVFIARGSNAPSVAGDFNNWDPTALTMERPLDGFDLYVAEAQLDANAGLYKLVVDGTFVADPLARRYGWDEFGEYSRVDARPDGGHHERWPRFDEAIGDLQPRPLRVWVPPAANAGTPVRVLIAHDGQNLFSPDAFFGGWQASQTAAALIEADEIAPLLIVGIDNTAARLDEYSHVPDDIGGGEVVGGRADEYADFVIDGVLPFVAERYPTLRGAENLGVIGSSMGGLVSLHLAQRHPDVFGFAGSMSGTLGWGAFGLDNETMRERYLADAPTGVTLYVDSGGDGPCPQGGSDNYCVNVAFVDALRSLGWTDEADLFYRWAPGAAHNEAAWASRFGDALRDGFAG